MSAYLKQSFLAILLVSASAHFAMAQLRSVTVEIDLSKTYQTVDNFGASDAWACQFVGNWPVAKKNKIADLLFSKDTLTDGSPKGIALSLWRFNIGSGSAQQGEKSGIKDEWRRAESFLDSPTLYNWRRQAGQLWFLEAARARGVAQFLGFCNSPPVQFTINHKAYADGGLTNIASNEYTSFASYLVNVIGGVKKNCGVSLNYISPVNEPQWAWSDGGQEGCPYSNKEIAALVKTIDSTFAASNVPSKLVIAEAGSINYLFTTGNKPDKGNQINEFFRPSSINYLGNLKSVKKTIAGHSYFTTSPLSASVAMRRVLADSVSKVPGLGFWQSEYCILGDNEGEINGSKRDPGMDAALYLATVIHTDLTAANASAWQWWTALSAYNYKDGLIYIDKNKSDGNFYTTKMLWGMGNYSRFIRPGAIRIDVSAMVEGATYKPLLISAFKNGKDFTAVIINLNSQTIPLNLHINSGNVVLTKRYITSETSDLKAEPVGSHQKSFKLSSRSITTITGITQ
ncbi:MAG TPA: glycoside hydrolase [Mucilaginibacter sp.]|jgi:O-glycosyl hydrolase